MVDSSYVQDCEQLYNVIMKVSQNDLVNPKYNVRLGNKHNTLYNAGLQACDYWLDYSLKI